VFELRVGVGEWKDNVGRATNRYCFSRVEVEKCRVAANRYCF
jgi:hypothetical protein